MKDQLETVLDQVLQRNPGEREFHQAVHEVFDSLGPVLRKHPQYVDAAVLEPAVRARAPDHLPGAVGRRRPGRGADQPRVPRRVQLAPSARTRAACASTRRCTWASSSSSASSRSSRTRSPACPSAAARAAPTSTRAAAPTARSCGSASRFMTELYRHIGEHTDVPAGDIGVGGREIGYLFGQYKRITNRYESGVLTGKGLDLGRLARAHRGDRLRHGPVRRAHARDQGPVASTAGACSSPAPATSPSTRSRRPSSSARTSSRAPTPTGYVVDEPASTSPCCSRPARPTACPCSVYAERRGASATFVPGRRVWEVGADIALPCATQNELDEDDALALIGVRPASPSPRARTCPPPRRPSALLQEAGVLYAPGKAANAGGVATSALEMQQNASRDSWTFELHRAAPRRDHALHPRPLPRDRRRVRGARQLRGRREHRRLHQGRRRDAGPRRRLTAPRDRHGRLRSSSADTDADLGRTRGRHRAAVVGRTFTRRERRRRTSAVQAGALSAVRSTVSTIVTIRTPGRHRLAVETPSPPLPAAVTRGQPGGAAECEVLASGATDG